MSAITYSPNLLGALIKYLASPRYCKLKLFLRNPCYEWDTPWCYYYIYNNSRICQKRPINNNDIDRSTNLQSLTAGLYMSISSWAQFRSPVKTTGFDFSSSCTHQKMNHESYRKTITQNKYYKIIWNKDVQHKESLCT